MTSLPRRRFLQLAAGTAAALPVMPRRGRAESYPSRSVRMVVGFAPAGVADITTRLIAQFFSQHFGQQFAVENRTGAGGNIATEDVSKSPADGYTLLTIGVSNTVNQALYGNLPFDFVRDIAPIATINRVANVVVVNPANPAKTFPEFMAYAKAHPGMVTMGTGGNGSTPHMFGELFKMMAGIDMPAIAYRGGGPALIDLLGNHVDVIFDPVPESIGYIRGGKLRPLAVTSAGRWDALPDMPPIGSFVPGYQAVGWIGLGAPKETPPEIVDALRHAVGAALADQTFKTRLADLGAVPYATEPAELTRLIADETVKWSKVVHAAGLKAG